MIVNYNQALLLIIDAQEKLLKNIKNSFEIKKNIKKSVNVANIMGVPIFLTEQYPKGLGLTDSIILNALQEFKKIEKNSFSVFSDGEFKKELSKSKKKQIIISGLETHICVLQSAIELKENNFDVFVLVDCTGSIYTKNHKQGIERLSQNNINLINTEMFIFELLRNSKHEKFKELSKLVK